MLDVNCGDVVEELDLRLRSSDRHLRRPVILSRSVPSDRHMTTNDADVHVVKKFTFAIYENPSITNSTSIFIMIDEHVDIF